ncbi:MAG: hypothetical protein JNK54_03065 [Elusimicrobia bacterium]|jgi:hypothetical protein|nr:hypothetical protein [Elusimicrobiota bacterium]
MNRKTIAVLILLNLGFLAAAGHLAWNRYQGLKSVAPAIGRSAIDSEPVLAPLPREEIEPGLDLPVPENNASSLHTSPEPEEVSLSSSVAKAIYRRTFSYDNSTAKSVQLVGDFNQWVPQAYRKNNTSQWSLTLSLATGDYAYNIIVDGKTIRDPNQRRSDEKGRSLLSVTP